ncbi:hypothetical protein T484DRAFT_1980627 [Baffinella frigidus]|nr:hypothetical protein T484DRAFT_1980627 [Cryptophyta sp. CCMP2293]|mmetsp:Transcript_18907/g.44050  ORF Transcript_18907/g.44050 Transcript_18907/m.44050 type:complete len:203 (-) Transcript_18907:61-669(-)
MSTLSILEEDESEDGAKRGGVVVRSLSLTQSSLEADESEDGTADKSVAMMKSLKTLNQPVFQQFQKDCRDTRRGTRRVLQVSAPPSELPKLVRERSSALLMRVQSMREHKKLDAETRTVFRADRSTKSDDQRSGPSPAKSSPSEFSDVRGINASRPVLLGFECSQFLIGDFAEVGQTVVARMIAQQEEKDSASIGYRQRMNR